MENIDKCIWCQEDLAPWERNRSECTRCREKTVETYEDELEENPNENEIGIR